MLCFFSNNSQFKTEKFNENEKKWFPVREGTDKVLEDKEYVAILCDTLRLKKNICICRHFHKLDKTFISKSNHIKYIDVWPINVFDPKSENPFDTVSLFMMQLACIINMLPKWKRLQLRIFLCDVSNESAVSNFDINVPQMEIFSKSQLEFQLNKLRINAEIHEVNDWSRNPDFTRHSAMKQFTDTSDIDDDAFSEESLNRSKLYMQR